MLKFICYPKCTTCQKAKKWLDDNKIEYELRDIKLNNPTLDELTKWYKNSGLPLKKFFNTSGLLYKSLDLKNKLPSMSEDEMLKLLASDGMLVKRPLLVGNGFVLVGFKEADYILTTKLFCGKCGALMFGESGTSATGAPTIIINAPTSNGARAATKRPCRRTGWKIWSSGRP